MEQKQLEPKQAIQIIYNALGQLALKREDHMLIEAAIKVMANLLPKEEENKEA